MLSSRVMTSYTFVFALFVFQSCANGAKKGTISVTLFKSSAFVFKYDQPKSWTSVVDNLVDIRKSFVSTRYYGVIGLGFPTQHFYVDFDTGASDFWVPSQRCSWFSLACQLHDKYDFHMSETYQKNGTEFHIEYGNKCGSVSGIVSNDTLIMGGVSIKGQEFGEATSMSSLPFLTAKFDGILGLAFSPLSVVSSLPPFFNAVSQQLIEPVFSFFLEKEPIDEIGGEITFGGVNPKHFTGKFYETPVVSHTYWGIEVDSIEYGNDTLCKYGFELIIASGISIMIGPKELVEKIHTKMNVTFSRFGIPEVNCSRIRSLPTIVFSFPSFKLEVTSNHYVVKMSLFGTEFCHSGFLGMDIETASSVWILGNNFMTAYYTKFDFENKTVGFAELQQNA